MKYTLPPTCSLQEAPLAEVAHAGFTPRQPVATDRGGVPAALPDAAAGSTAVRRRSGTASGEGSRSARAGGADAAGRPVGSGRRVARADGAHSPSGPTRSGRASNGRLGRGRAPAGRGASTLRTAGGSVLAGLPAEEPPEHLLPVLEQLLTGATDVTASQRLGMSPRTFSRRVSELLDYLGVLSRFQAGVASVNRGWVAAQLDPSGRAGR